MSHCLDSEDWELDTDAVVRNNDTSLLELISENRHDEIMKLYRDQDLNFHITLDEEHETTPLLFAITQGNLECVKTLMTLKANVNYGWKLIRSNPNSFTRPLFHAITLNVSTDIIETILDSNVNLNLTDGNNDTPLTLGISKGRNEFVTKLLQKGCSNIVGDICWLIIMKKEIQLSTWKDTGIHEFIYQGDNADRLAVCAAYHGHEEVLRNLALNNYTLSKCYHNLSLIKDLRIPFIGHNFSLLHLAVLGHQKYLIDFLINGGCDVNTEDANGNTSIHCAAFVGNVKLLEKLIVWNVDVSRQTHKNTSALYIAVESSQFDFVKKLVELGWFRSFEPPKPSSINKQRDRESDPLSLAIFLKNYNITKVLLESCSPLESLHELHYSISEGNAKLANLIINHLSDKGNLLKNDSISGIPTLHLLSDARVIFEKDVTEFAALVRYYVLKGYDINRKSYFFKSKKRTARGFTALHAAVDRKNINVVKLLIENGADVNAVDEYGYSALHWCALVNDKSIMEILISAGANSYAKTKTGLPVIHVAADEGHIEIVHALLNQDISMIHWKAKYIGFLPPDVVDNYPSRYNIDQEGSEIKWCTPFQRAVYMSKVDVCRLLIISGSQLEGLEELHYSVRQGDIAIANVIFGSIPNTISLAYDTIKNEPALSRLPCRCLIEFSEDMPKFLLNYIRRGYDINSMSASSNCKCEDLKHIELRHASLLHMAVLHNNVEMVECLLDHGADMDLCTDQLHTPLFLAVYLKLTEIFLLLFRDGADINKKGIMPGHNTKDLRPGELVSPIGLSIYSRQRVIFQHLNDENAELNGLEELHIAMKSCNIFAALEILKRLPPDISMKHQEDEVSLLHALIESCSDELDDPAMISAVGELIKECIRRGYNIDFNGSHENIKPLLFEILKKCIRHKNTKILDVITSLDKWDPNVKLYGETALRTYLNGIETLGLNCDHHNQHKYCALDCALTLLKYGADASGSTVHLKNTEHSAKWKVLSTFGVKIILDADCGPDEKLHSFVEKSNGSVKKLKHLARLAVRKFTMEFQMQEASSLPRELKKYLYLERIHSIANVPISALELESSHYD